MANIEKESGYGYFKITIINEVSVLKINIAEDDKVKSVFALIVILKKKGI